VSVWYFLRMVHDCLNPNPCPLRIYDHIYISVV
jgi:hypothetical protein